MHFDMIGERQRNTPSLWFTVTVILALLLNQGAVASHVCLGAADAGATTGTATSADPALGAGAASQCHGPRRPDGPKLLCQVHCADHAKVSSGQADLWPALPAAGGCWPGSAASADRTAATASIAVISDARHRRRYWYCSLQI